MVAELRKVNNKLALYTDDERIYKCFSKWPHTSSRIRYTQSGKLVGIDFYFDRRLRRTVRQVINGQLMLGNIRT